MTEGCAPSLARYGDLACSWWAAGLSASCRAWARLGPASASAPDSRAHGDQTPGFCYRQSRPTIAHKIGYKRSCATPPGVRAWASRPDHVPQDAASRTAHSGCGSSQRSLHCLLMTEVDLGSTDGGQGVAEAPVPVGAWSCCLLSARQWRSWQWHTSPASAPRTAFGYSGLVGLWRLDPEALTTEPRPQSLVLFNLRQASLSCPG